MRSWKLLAAATAAAFGLAAAPASAEVSELKMMSQYGIGYMQLTLMKADKLVEKHLAKAGLGGTTVTWATMGAGAAANDALLSGSLHFAAGGTGWARRSMERSASRSWCVHPERPFEGGRLMS